MESDPADKYPVGCHAVLGRRALPAAGGGGHMTTGSPELFHRSRLLEPIGPTASLFGRNKKAR